MFPTGMQSLITAPHFGFLRTVLWNFCSLNGWHREFNIQVILFSVLLQRKPAHTSPDLRKLRIFSCHLNNKVVTYSCFRQRKEVVMYISNIKNKVSCSILPFKYLQVMLFLTATEKRVYTSTQPKNHEN